MNFKHLIKKLIGQHFVASDDIVDFLRTSFSFTLIKGKPIEFTLL